MNASEPSFDRRGLHELASAAMDGSATAAQHQELTELLRSNAAARDEYLTIVDLHAVLAGDFPRSSSAAGTERSASIDRSRRVLRPQLRWVSSTGVMFLATCLLIAVGWFFSRGRVQPMNNTNQMGSEVQRLARVAQESGAVWDSKKIEVGHWLGPEKIRLTSGIVRLEFDSGVEVTLQGPAEFELLSLTRMKLKDGLLTADVPPGAEGFTVDTPMAEVVDLGTSFGIDLRDDAHSNVSVFDGEVTVDARDGSGKRLLGEGDSIQIRRDQTVAGLDLDPLPFERLWPIASGITGSTENMQFLPPWPRQIRFVKSDNVIYLAVERRSMALTESLAVNISRPGKYFQESELTPLELLAGEQVRSYVLHYAPSDRIGPRRADRISGSITFDRPILGLVVQHEELLASSRLFSRRGRGEKNPRRELRLNGSPNGDRISLSEDRMTLTVDLVAPGRSSDLVRVIVEDDRRGNGVAPRRQLRNRFGNVSVPTEKKEASP